MADKKGMGCGTALVILLGLAAFVGTVQNAAKKDSKPTTAAPTPQTTVTAAYGDGHQGEMFSEELGLYQASLAIGGMIENGIAEVHGIIGNSSENNYKTVKITFNIKDSIGEIITTAEAVIENLNANETSYFEATAEIPNYNADTEYIYEYTSISAE